MIFSENSYRTIFSIPADKPITIYSPYVVGPGATSTISGCMIDVFICDACAMMWPQHGYDGYDEYDHFADENCDPWCTNCERPSSEHLDDKCLFGPDKLNTKRYVFTWEGK